MFPTLATDVEKLLLAALLGGLIGLERESKHRPAGLRTNLFICVGRRHVHSSLRCIGRRTHRRHTRIAAQIIPGIGFIGAGSIIHARGDLVTGITSAATLFVSLHRHGRRRRTVSNAIFATLLDLGSSFAARISGTLQQPEDNDFRLRSDRQQRRSKPLSRSTDSRAAASHDGESCRSRPPPATFASILNVEGTREKQDRIYAILRDSKAFESVAALGPVQPE